MKFQTKTDQPFAFPQTTKAKEKPMVKKKIKVKIIMKKKLKMTTALLASLFLVSIIAVSTPTIAAEPDRILMIDIMAKGDDLDISGASTTTVAKIEYDKVSGAPLGRVEFHIKIYDESGEKIYSMKGKLKEAASVFIYPFWYCPVRDVTWINFWYVTGEGMIKTTDTDMEILYRGQIIALPNTGGKWSPATIVMLVSPNGEHTEGFWPQGGWAYAGLGGFFGGVAYLTKYMEKLVP